VECKELALREREIERRGEEKRRENRGVPE